MNRDVTVNLTGRGEFSMKRVEYDADCVVVYAFIETESEGQEAVDITTEIAGNMDGDNLIEAIAMADAEALKTIALQLERRPDDVYGAFIYHLTQQIQKERERQASECTETN